MAKIDQSSADGIKWRYIAHRAELLAYLEHLAALSAKRLMATAPVMPPPQHQQLARAVAPAAVNRINGPLQRIDNCLLRSIVEIFCRSA